MSGSGLRKYQLTYEICPIILTNGIAGDVSGLPIISLTESRNFSTGLLSGGGDMAFDDYFAHFIPLPGATLVDQDIATYPFANQAVAANAVVENPLRVSLLMVCPARGDGGYSLKHSILTSLQSSLQLHNTTGGTYTVATPSYTYTNSLMVGFRDVSAREGKQIQDAWQLDFIQPLLTVQQAAQSQNNLISRMTRGTRINSDPAWSGLEFAVGVPPSLSSTSVVPAAQDAGGAGTAAPLGSPLF